MWRESGFPRERELCGRKVGGRVSPHPCPAPMHLLSTCCCCCGPASPPPAPLPPSSCSAPWHLACVLQRTRPPGGRHDRQLHCGVKLFFLDGAEGKFIIRGVRGDSLCMIVSLAVGCCWCCRSSEGDGLRAGLWCELRPESGTVAGRRREGD